MDVTATSPPKVLNELNAQHINISGVLKLILRIYLKGKLSGNTSVQVTHPLNSRMQRREYSLHVSKQEFFIYSFARLLGESTHSTEYVKSTLLSVQLKYLTCIRPCQCHRHQDRIPIPPP